jgi:hypothetical protein
MQNVIEQKNHIDIMVNQVYKIVEIEILSLSKDYGFGLAARSQFQ